MEVAASTKNFHSATYCRKNNVISGSQQDLTHIESEVESYYEAWNKAKFTGENKGASLGFGISIFEIAVGGAIAWFQPCASTITNLATSFGELGEVFITNMKKGKKENILAAFIGGCGVLGFGKAVWDSFSLFNGREYDHELPWYKNVLLSVGSLISSFFMVISFAEKSTFAHFASKTRRNEDGEIMAQAMRLNGGSDERCSLEWLVVSSIPILNKLNFENFKLGEYIRLVFDFLLPSLAIKNCVQHFWNARKNLDNGSEGKVEIAPAPELTFKKFYFGDKEDTGFRAKCLVPFYRFVGLNPPTCFINDKNELEIKIPNAKPTVNNSTVQINSLHSEPRIVALQS